MSAFPASSVTGTLAGRVEAATQVVPDFPRLGVSFRDLGGLWADPDLFADVTAAAAEEWSGRVDSVVGVDARGFLLGATVAQRLSLPLVLARKSGKLPGSCRTVSYDLEYGTAELAMRSSDVARLGSALVVDDLLATGGTLAAVQELVVGGGGSVTGFAVAVDLRSLGGSKALGLERVWAAFTVAEEEA